MSSTVYQSAWGGTTGHGAKTLSGRRLAHDEQATCAVDVSALVSAFPLLSLGKSAFSVVVDITCMMSQALGTDRSHPCGPTYISGRTSPV